MVGHWGLINLNMKGMAWVWRCLSILGISSSGGSVGVPGGVSSSIAGLIGSGSLVSIGAVIGHWSLINLNMKSMSGIRRSLSILRISSSGSGVGVPG